MQENELPTNPEAGAEAGTADTTTTMENPENNAENAALNPEIAELKQQLEESKNKYLYLYSDFENFRRNAARERQELSKTAGRDIMTAMLSVLDDFDRAAKNGALSEGTQLIHHKLVHTLQGKGLELMETKAGDSFNADYHEAITEIPAPTEDLKGKIVDVIEPAYRLGDRIIRFAKVVVGN